MEISSAIRPKSRWMAASKLLIFRWLQWISGGRKGCAILRVAPVEGGGCDYDFSDFLASLRPLASCVRSSSISCFSRSFMSSKKVRVVVQGGDGRNVVQDLALHGQAPRIKVQPKVKYLLQGHDDGLGPENVTATRVGHDLHIALEGESSPGLILEDYFSGSDVEGLFGGAEDGRLHSYVPTDGGEIFDLAEGE